MPKHTLIIGAGIGGLSAAIHLAAAGQRVTILEQNPAVGGKMGEMVADGFRWDVGPSVITMRYVFEDLFAVAGRKLDDYLTLLPVDPLTRYFYPDGTILDAALDPQEMSSRIRAFAGEDDAQGYLRYLDYARRIHEITGPVFIYNDPPTLWRLARTRLRDIPAVDPLRTMDASIRGFVRSSKLRQLLGRFATYVGASPYLAPATLNVIAHVELSGGVWYPQGGIYSIARAYQRLARELGVDIQTNCHVQQIVVENGRVSGVALTPSKPSSSEDVASSKQDELLPLAPLAWERGLGGEGLFIPADVVIANVDVATVYEKLLPREVVSQRRLKRLTNAEPSCSGFILLLGVEGIHTGLAHHNIFFSADYRREFDDIFKRGIPPDDPTIYVAITSKTDPAHAPAGCENWFVLVNAPPLGEAFDWSAQASAYRDKVLATLAMFGYDLRGKIRVERMLTPLDLERLTGARRGALYGTSSNDRFNALRRPHNRAPDVRGLYFAGGTTHPGGGVPMVTLSGKVAARMVMEDKNR
jgi:phytoene dehydrogenase-like protein